VPTLRSRDGSSAAALCKSVAGLIGVMAKPSDQVYRSSGDIDIERNVGGRFRGAKAVRQFAASAITASIR
jgi:hypothetical protein